MDVGSMQPFPRDCHPGRERLFKGIASTLVAASITSLCFLGFSGMLEKIFGM